MRANLGIIAVAIVPLFLWPVPASSQTVPTTINLFAITKKVPEWSRSDAKVTIVVTEDDITDVVHQAAAGSLSSEAGRGSVYRVSSAVDIYALKTKPRALRVAVRGQDAWKPEHFFMFATDATDGVAALPLGVQWAVTPTLQAPDEASSSHTSTPVKRIASNPATPIRRLVLFVQTGGGNFGTNDQVRLRVLAADQSVLVTTDFPNGTGIGLRTSEVGVFFLPVVRPFTLSEFEGGTLALQAQGSDLWKPSSFFLFGLDALEGEPSNMVPLITCQVFRFPGITLNAAQGRADLPIRTKFHHSFGPLGQSVPACAPPPGGYPP